MLTNRCAVAAAFTPGQTPQQFQEFDALWDTGATNSAITQSVVSALGLQPTGVKNVRHAGGVSPANTYLVNIGLPNGVAFANLEVTLVPITDAQIIIGMDIISQGDFSITNVGGKTVFSYRYPSIRTIDYADEARRIRKGIEAGRQSFHKVQLKKNKKRH